MEIKQLKQLTLEQARARGGAWMDSGFKVYGSLDEALENCYPGETLRVAYQDSKPDVSDLVRELYDQINDSAEEPEGELGWLCHMDGEEATSTAIEVASEADKEWFARLDDALSSVAAILLEKHGHEGQPWWEGDEYLIAP